MKKEDAYKIAHDGLINNLMSDRIKQNCKRNSRFAGSMRKNNIVPFIILHKDKLFYYRGLNEYQHGREKGYLIDTCLNAQDQYQKLIEKFIGNLS